MTIRNDEHRPESVPYLDPTFDPGVSDVVASESQPHVQTLVVPELPDGSRSTPDEELHTTRMQLHHPNDKVEVRHIGRRAFMGGVFGMALLGLLTRDSVGMASTAPTSLASPIHSGDVAAHPGAEARIQAGQRAEARAAQRAYEAHEKEMMKMPDRESWYNAQFLGVMEIRYDPKNDSLRAEQFSEIDAYWKQVTKNPNATHPKPDNPNVHAVLAASRNPNPPKLPDGNSSGFFDEEQLQDNGMMVDNSPNQNPLLYIAGTHDVTKMNVKVKVGNTVYDDPYIGLNEPVIKGDTLTWLYPTSDGRTTIFTFRATKIDIGMPSSNAYYQKMMATKVKKPTLITLQCYPYGSSDKRTYITWELEGVARSDIQVALAA